MTTRPGPPPGVKVESVLWHHTDGMTSRCDKRRMMSQWNVLIVEFPNLEGRRLWMGQVIALVKIDGLTRTVSVPRMEPNEVSPTDRLQVLFDLSPEFACRLK